MAWTRAFVRHTKIPAVDIFSSLDASREQLFGMPGWESADSTPDTQFYSEMELPTRCNAYDVFHSPGGIDFTSPSYLRSRYAQRIFPITCPQYGISYSFDLPTAFIPILTAHILPCDAIVCLTRSSRWAMEKRLTDISERYARAWNQTIPLLPRLELIPCGVDTQIFAPRDPEQARRELNLPHGRPIVLSNSRIRIHDKMDFTPLLLAFQHICRGVDRPPLLVLAGSESSDYTHQILERARELGIRHHITTFFNLPTACLPTLYAAADVFVAPTDTPSESFGLTVVEAMACGRPVVASDWDGYQELIVHGKTGFKVRADWADCLGELDRMGPLLPWYRQHLHVGQSVSLDVGQLAGYLTDLLCNPALRQKMGRHGRARVMQLYDWPVVIKQWETLWAELSGIASGLEKGRSDPFAYLAPHYFQHFSHYASRIVGDTTPIRLTERGSETLDAKGPLYLHRDATGLLQHDQLLASLSALKRLDQPPTVLRIGDLVSAMDEQNGLTPEQALRHIMWLAKYDLVVLGED